MSHMLKTTTPCNRWKIFLSLLHPHYILFSLTTLQRVANFCNSIRKIQNQNECMKMNR